jgi:ketosteroid isomerase-like protein
MTASGSIKLAPTSLFSCTNTSLLEIELSHAPITTATLEAFSAAWNRHDIDALMSFMTDDCVFMTAAGPDVCGTRHAGTEAVRKAFAGAWGSVPDVQWLNGKHFVQGDFGVSEWTFVGTAADGSRIETDGVDLFTFRDGKIAVKNAFRKARPNLPASK